MTDPGNAIGKGDTSVRRIAQATDGTHTSVILYAVTYIHHPAITMSANVCPTFPGCLLVCPPVCKLHFFTSLAAALLLTNMLLRARPCP